MRWEGCSPPNREIKDKEAPSHRAEAGSPTATEVHMPGPPDCTKDGVQHLERWHESEPRKTVESPIIINVILGKSCL